MVANYNETKTPAENLARAVFAVAEALDDKLEDIAFKLDTLAENLTYHAQYLGEAINPRAPNSMPLSQVYVEALYWEDAKGGGAD
jgi:hypothetical protein